MPKQQVLPFPGKSCLLYDYSCSGSWVHSSMGMHICAFVGMKSLKCLLQPHRLYTSHIYNIYLRTVHRGLAPLGQVKDCSLELCSLDRLGPKDCPSVVILVRFRQGLATPGKALLQSILSLESVQHRM